MRADPTPHLFFFFLSLFFFSFVAAHLFVCLLLFSLSLSFLCLSYQDGVPNVLLDVFNFLDLFPVEEEEEKKRRVRWGIH